MFLVLLLEEVDACCVLVPEWVSATFFFFFQELIHLLVLT